MKYPNVYKLSKKYGPPKVDLREAEIIDSYGDETRAQLLLNHQLPDDVTRQHLDYYGWIYSFLEASDLIFYLYPIAREFELDIGLDCIDPFFYALERHICVLTHSLTNEDKRALLEGLNWIWDAGGEDGADWVQCPQLQEMIGINLQ